MFYWAAEIDPAGFVPAFINASARLYVNHFQDPYRLHFQSFEDDIVRLAKAKRARALDILKDIIFLTDPEVRRYTVRLAVEDVVAVAFWLDFLIHHPELLEECFEEAVGELVDENLTAFTFGVLERFLAWCENLKRYPVR